MRWYFWNYATRQIEGRDSLPESDIDGRNYIPQTDYAQSLYTMFRWLNNSVARALFSTLAVVVETSAYHPN